MKALFVSIIIFPAFAFADNAIRISKIYELGKMNQEPLFVQTTEIRKQDLENFSSNAKIEDSRGQVVMTESVIVQNGSLVSQSVEQLQTKESWDLTVRDKKAYFNTYKLTAEGRQQVGSGKTEEVDAFINGPLIEKFISRNWENLISGKHVNTAFSVLELERTIGFRFEKIKESERATRKVLVVKMKPQNFFVSVLVDPIILEFDISTKQLVYFKGRTPLKVLKAGDWKPLDAEILYQEKL